MSKIDKSEKYFMLFFIVITFLLGFSVSQAIGTARVNEVLEEGFSGYPVPESEQEIIDNCNYLDLEDTAICLRDNIREFYIYTVTDDDVAKEMTLDEIKEVGTDCGGYAFLYERLAKELGFKANTNYWEGMHNVYPGHRWATIWDDENYCRIDMLKVYCDEVLDE